MLLDLPTTLPILEAIWGNDNFTVVGAGGDYAMPGTEIQHLHSDMQDPFNDPLSQVSISDMPTPFIVVNYLMTEFSANNGAIRFVPGTQRTRLHPPALIDEPQHWRNSIACAPAGTAIVRDVRCWHGGTPNRSNAPRVMTSAGYFAPWFRQPGIDRCLPMQRYQQMSQRSRMLCCDVVDWASELG